MTQLNEYPSKSLIIKKVKRIKGSTYSYILFDKKFISVKEGYIEEYCIYYSGCYYGC